MNREQSTPQWQHQGGDHLWTYLFSYSNRGNCMAICRCHLSLMPDSLFPCWSYWTWSLLLLCIPCQKKMAGVFHLSMPSPHDLQHVLDQPVCSKLYYSYTWLTVAVLYTSVYFLHNILWPEVQSHSSSSHMHATAMQLPCIHLVAQVVASTVKCIDINQSLHPLYKDVQVNK